MNTTSAPPRDPNAPPSPFSDHLKGLLEALECLYIRNNTSGRRGFVQAWPHAAPYVFDEQLLTFDAQGVESEQHREQRKALEKVAEERRDALIEFLETLEEKSVFDGMLQVEFVREIMMRYRREMLLYLYAEHIVNKFVPPPPSLPDSQDPQASKDPQGHQDPESQAVSGGSQGQV